ncbi:MAG: PAS domain S-box protein [Spirochaetes bacterium]|nr:PAS domain S-box protein [Spirochaetota bacterium]
MSGNISNKNNTHLKNNTFEKTNEYKAILEAVAKNSRDAIEISKNGIHVWVNSSYLKLFGYDNEEIINKTVLNQIAPSQKKFIQDKIKKHSSGKQVPEVYQTIGLRKNKDEFDMEVSVSNYKYQNENYTFVQLRDISKEKENEQNFYSLFNNMIEGVALHELVMDKNGKPVNYRIIAVNDQYEKIVGKLKKNVIGKLATEVYNMHDAPKLKEFSNTALSGNPIQFESFFPSVDRHFFISVSPWGEKGFATIFFDISEIKKIEDELKRKSDELNRYFNYSLDLLCIADMEGYFRKLNPEWEKTLGYKLNELIDKKFLNLVHPDDIQSTLNSISDLKNSKSILNFENRYRCKDGSYKWIEWRSFPYNNMIYAVARDITKHKDIDKSLLEREKLLNESQKIARLGHYVFNAYTGNWTGSETLYDILGINESYTKNVQGWLNIIHPEERESMKNYLLEHVVKKKNIFNREYKIIRYSDKQLRWIHGLGNLKFNKKGSTIEMFGTIQDITDRKNYEIALKEKSEELKSINREMEQLIYITSHDLRSPLINIEGFTKELNSSIEKVKNIIIESELKSAHKKSIVNLINDDIEHSLIYISKSVNKMGRLLNALLKLSRIGKIDNKMQKINMNILIKNIMHSLEYQIKTNKIEIKVHNLPDCYGNELQLTQLFTNLIDNAIKYRKQNKKCKILIRGSIKNINKCLYIIKDNGIGIPEDYQKKIFELFYRLNPDLIEGEGLGLTIAYKIVENHKGRIWIDSNEKEGSSFFIELFKDKFD